MNRQWSYCPGGVDTQRTRENLTPPMSKKGCTPDNAACEGFFGRPKNEMYSNGSRRDVTIEGFIDLLDEHGWSSHIKRRFSWPFERTRSKQENVEILISL